MSPARSTFNALEALSRELSEVEWFGDRSRPITRVEVEPVRSGMIDFVLVVLGAAIGALLYMLTRS